jgi:hypothetical protein
MTTIRTILMTVLLATVVLVGCGNNSTPANPPSIPTVPGLPEGEPTLAPNVPVEGYPAPDEIIMPTQDPASYPAPAIMPTLPANYPAP